MQIDSLNSDLVDQTFGLGVPYNYFLVIPKCRSARFGEIKPL